MLLTEKVRRAKYDHMKTLTVGPAYGRDYKSKVEVLEAWGEGKDFAINGDPLAPVVNVEEISNLMMDGYEAITFRYKKLREAFVLVLHGD